MGTAVIGQKNIYVIGAVNNCLVVNFPSGMYYRAVVIRCEEKHFSLFRLGLENAASKSDPEIGQFLEYLNDEGYDCVAVCRPNGNLSGIAYMPADGDHHVAYHPHVIFNLDDPIDAVIVQRALDANVHAITSEETTVTKVLESLMGQGLIGAIHTHLVGE